MLDTTIIKLALWPFIYSFDVCIVCILSVYFPENSNDNLESRVAKVDNKSDNIDGKIIKDSDVSESNEIAEQIAGEQFNYFFWGGGDMIYCMEC